MSVKFKEIRDALMNKIDAAKDDLDGTIAKKLLEVKYWNYATDIHYTHIPYDHELFKIKKGRKLTKMSFDDRLTKRTIHSFGFDRDNRLIIMQNPNVDNDISFGVSTQLYFIKSDKSVETYVARWYPQKDFPTTLEALSILSENDDGNLTYVGMNANKRNWSSMEYIRNEAGRIEKVESVVYPPPPPSDGISIYDFEYGNEGELVKILAGSVVWWSKK